MSSDQGQGAATLLASPVRRRLVDILANPRPDRHPGRTAAQLAEEVGLHVTTVRFHLDQLVAAGLVQSSFLRTSTVGRPRKVYAVAPGSLADLHHVDSASSLRMLTGLLARTVGARTDGTPTTPMDAGRLGALEHVAADPHARPAETAGQWIGKVGRMVDALHEWGYTPEVSTAGGGRTARVVLRNCPFLDLARDNPAVVCGIHRGIIAGSLEQLGEPDTVVGLEPFVDPTTCVAQLTTRTVFHATPTKEPA